MSVLQKFTILTVVYAICVTAVLVVNLQKPEPSATVSIVYDTITIEKPVTHTVERIRYDTVVLATAPDTTHTVSDSARVYLPIERSTYSDSLCRIDYSGYHASLDRVELFVPTRITTTQCTASPWSIALTAGVGVNRKGEFSPQLTLGISYSLFTFGSRRGNRR